MNVLEVVGNVIPQIYANHSDFNDMSEDLTVDFGKEFSKLDRFSLKDKFSHTFEPRSLEDAFGRTSGRYSYYKNQFNLEYSRDIAQQFSFATRYTNQIDEVSREDLKDSGLNKIGFEADYWTSSDCTLFSSYDFSRRKFDPGQDSSTHRSAQGDDIILPRNGICQGKWG